MKNLTTVISMRLSAEDEQLLRRVADLVPVVPRLTLARLALRLGLEAIKESPARALAVRTRKPTRT